MTSSNWLYVGHFLISVYNGRWLHKNDDLLSGCLEK